MLLCKVDTGKLVQSLNVVDLKVGDHLERLHVAQVLVKSEVSVHFESDGPASVQNLSLVITGVGFFQTFGLSLVSSIKDLMMRILMLTQITPPPAPDTHLTSEV